MKYRWCFLFIYTGASSCAHDFIGTLLVAHSAQVFFVWGTHDPAGTWWSEAFSWLYDEQIGETSFTDSGSYAIHTPKMLLPCSSFSWFMLFSFSCICQSIRKETLVLKTFLRTKLGHQLYRGSLPTSGPRCVPATWKCHSGSRPSLWFLQWGMGQRRGWQIPFFYVAHIGFGQQESKYILEEFLDPNCFS